MSSKQLSLSSEQIEKLYKVSEASSRAHRNNLRLTQGLEATTYRNFALDYKRKKLALELLVEEINALEEERKMVERELDGYELSLKVSRERLEHSTGTEFRSLPILHLEISSLEAKVNEFSDADLGLMEKIDALTTKRADFDTDLKVTLARALAAKEELESLRMDVAKSDLEFQKEIANAKNDLDSGLEGLLNRVPNQIIDKVAFVTESSCSGCRLRISSILSDRIKRFASEIHYCEECGRLLLPQRGSKED